MDPINSVQQLVAGITSFVGDDYEVCSGEDILTRILSLCPIAIEEKAVVRVRRSGANSSRPRTVILAALKQSEHVKLFLSWCASTRETLTDPEASDLYGMVIALYTPFTLDDCLSFEASETYCRKYMVRPGETIEGVLSRSFFAPISDTRIMSELSDPLLAALNNTSAVHDWFDNTERERWRSAFLSGETGSELIENLFEDLN